MNDKSKTDPTRPSTTTSQRQLNKWFIRQGGKEFAPTTKPLDTLDHIQKRIVWIREYYQILTDINAPVAYLDDKWFYTTNRQRPVKKLPRLPDEEEGSDFVPPSKVRSRRFPIKVIFMRDVGRPIESKNFGGRINLERVSETVEIRKLTGHQNFCDDVVINQQIKEGS